MRRIIILSAVFMMVAVSVFAGSERLRVPKVTYIEPNEEAIVDLTGRKSLTFRWNSQPVPAGGRVAYKFTLYKGFGYDVVASESVDPKAFSIEIPAEKFEDGATYTWHVKQRDGGNMLWSLFTNWSFKVIKK